jgi:hypothetical protein
MNDWQRRQAAECSCKGSDDMCPCQNVERRASGAPVAKAEHPILNRRLDEFEWSVRSLGAMSNAGMDIAGARVTSIPCTCAYVPCVAKVKVSSIATRTREFRAEKTLSRGLPIEQCAERSTWRVDGLPLCLGHGGRRALAILAGEETLPPIVGRGR